MKPPRPFRWATICLFICIAIAPIAYMMIMPFLGTSETAVVSTIVDPRYFSLARNSICVALGTSLCSFLLGTCLAFFCSKTDMPGRRCLQCLLIAPLLIPPYLHAIVWEQLSPLIQEIFHVDIHCKLGIVWVLSLAYFPFVSMTTLAGISSLDREKEEASLLVNGPVRMVSRITLPLCMPHILSGTLFVFVFSIINVSVPDIFRVPVYPLEIFIQFSAFFDTRAAMILSLPVVAITIFLIIVQRLWMGERSYVSLGNGEKTRLTVSLKPFFGMLCFLVLVFFLGCAFFVPLITLLLKAGGIRSYIQVISSSTQALISSFLLAISAAFIATLLGSCLSYLQQRSERASSSILAYLVIFPLAIPATTLGIGLIGVWNTHLLGWVYGGAGIVVVAHVARFTPYAATIMYSGFGQISPRIEEAAALSGAGFLAIGKDILMKLTWRHQIVSAAFVFILAFGELGATLLVSPPGIETVPVKIYNLMHYGADELMAALSILMLLLIFGVSLIFFIVFRKRPTIR